MTKQSADWGADSVARAEARVRELDDLTKSQQSEISNLKAQLVDLMCFALVTITSHSLLIQAELSRQKQPQFDESYYQDMLRNMESVVKQHLDARKRSGTCIRSAVDAIDMYTEQLEKDKPRRTQSTRDTSPSDKRLAILARARRVLSDALQQDSSSEIAPSPPKQKVAAAGNNDGDARESETNDKLRREVLMLRLRVQQLESELSDLSPSVASEVHKIYMLSVITPLTRIIVLGFCFDWWTAIAYLSQTACFICF